MENKLELAGSLLEELGAVLKEAGREQNKLLSKIEVLECEMNNEKDKRYKALNSLAEIIKELY